MERVALLAHLPLFHECRAGLLRVAESALDGSAAALDYAAAPGDLRQRGLDGSPADLDALYAAADAAAAPFAAALERCGEGFEAAARKPRSRAKAKAAADYATRSAPGASWLRDVLRASVVCDDEAAVLDAFRRLAANCDVAAVKNRFRRPALNGYRDVLVTVRVPAGGGFHLCEIQIHHRALRDAAAALGAPKTYAFFRDFCALAPAAAEKALDRLVDELIDVPRGELLTLNDLVMRTLVDYAESAPDLDRFARLLDCVGARAYAAKVRSRIDTLQQRDRDRHLWSHEAADYGAALCVSDGGADAGERVRRIEADLAGLEGMAIPAKRARLDCLHDLALLHRAARRFDDARAYFSKALDAADACGGPARGVVRTDWAGLLQDCGDDDGALEAYRAALDVYVDTFGAGDKLCATPLANLARALANVGDYVAAVDRYAACLAIRERVFGPDHGSALAALAALGRARRLAGDAAGAEDCARRGVALREAGGPSPDATLGFLRLARLLEARGEAAEALVYFEQALAAFEAVLGADHEDVGSVLNDAARCRRDARQYGAATTLLERRAAAADRDRPGDVDGAAPLNNLALALELAGDAARAEAALRRALARCEAPLGPRHPRVRTLFANLAHVLLSSDAPGVEDALNDLGETLRAAGLYEAAEPVYRRSVAVCEKRRGRDSLEVTPKLNNLALLLQHMGRHGDEAEALLARCLTIHERVFGPDHIDVAAPLNNLAILLQARGRHADAEPKIRRSLALVEARFGADHGHAATLRGNLAALVEDKRAADAARADRDTSDDDSDDSDGGSDGDAAAEAASRAAPTPPNSPSDAAEEVASCAAPTPPNSPSDGAEAAAARNPEPPEPASPARRSNPVWGSPPRPRPSIDTQAVVLESRLREKTLLAAERERDARDAKTAATTLAADVARLEREKAELEIRCKDAELSPKVVKMQKRNEQLGAHVRDLAEALEASTREREDLAARVDGAAAAAAAAAASAASTPAAEAPSDAGAAVAAWAEAELGCAPDDARRLGRRCAEAFGATRGDDLLDGDVFGDLRELEAHGLKAVPAKRLAAKRAAVRDAEAAAGDIAAWLARELGVRAGDAATLAAFLARAGATSGAELLDPDLFDDLGALEAHGLRPVPRKKLLRKRTPAKAPPATPPASPPAAPAPGPAGSPSDGERDDAPEAARPAAALSAARTYDEALGAREAARLRGELADADARAARAAAARDRSRAELDAVVELAANRASFAEDLARAADRCDRAEAHAARLDRDRAALRDRVAEREAAVPAAWHRALAENRPRARSQVDVDGDREGFDASAGAADYDAFANDTPVRTYDLSNARGGDDDGPMSDAEEASYQDALLGICMDLPMLRGRKEHS